MHFPNRFLFLLSTFLACGCANTGVDRSTITGPVTTGTATVNFSPELRIALGDSAIAAVKSAITSFYAATPGGASVEAVKQAVQAGAKAYEDEKGKPISEGLKAQLESEVQKIAGKKKP